MAAYSRWRRSARSTQKPPQTRCCQLQRMLARAWPPRARPLNFAVRERSQMLPSLIVNSKHEAKQQHARRSSTRVLAHGLHLHSGIAVNASIRRACAEPRVLWLLFHTWTLAMHCRQSTGTLLSDAGIVAPRLARAQAKSAASLTGSLAPEGRSIGELHCAAGGCDGAGELLPGPRIKGAPRIVPLHVRCACLCK